MTTMTRRALAAIAWASMLVGATGPLTAQAPGQTDAEQQLRTMRGRANALVAAKNYAAAADELEGLQMLLMREHRHEEALKVSFEIEEAAGKASERRSPWHYVRIGEVHLAMGHRNQFFEWVEKAIRERSFSRLEYFDNPQFDGIRDEPRFRHLVDACAAIVGIGREAKDFEVRLLDGTPFRLSAQRGKVVLVDFRDVRCGPCRKEMPNLKAIYGTFKDRGFEVLGISLDTEKPLLTDYIAQAGLPWKIACSWDGWDDRTAKLYGVSATPSTWLIDRRGIVRYAGVKGDDLRRAVEILVAELAVTSESDHSSRLPSLVATRVFPDVVPSTTSNNSPRGQRPRRGQPGQDTGCTVLPYRCASQ